MGRLKGPYHAEFPPGTTVRVTDVSRLAEFRKNWRFHHPLADEQFAYAGAVAVVEMVSFYHGGDELYRLQGIVGVWHESCLEMASADEG